MTKRINATVSDELYNFAESVNKGNRSYVVKLALTCLHKAQEWYGPSWMSEMHEASRALKEMRREYGANWQDKLIEQRRDDNFFDEEYS